MQKLENDFRIAIMPTLNEVKRNMLIINEKTDIGNMFF